MSERHYPRDQSYGQVQKSVSSVNRQSQQNLEDIDSIIDPTQAHSSNFQAQQMYPSKYVKSSHQKVPSINMQNQQRPNQKKMPQNIHNQIQ